MWHGIRKICVRYAVSLKNIVENEVEDIIRTIHYSSEDFRFKGLDILDI